MLVDECYSPICSRNLRMSHIVGHTKSGLCTKFFCHNKMKAKLWPIVLVKIIIENCEFQVVDFDHRILVYLFRRNL